MANRNRDVLGISFDAKEGLKALENNMMSAMEDLSNEMQKKLEEAFSKAGRNPKLKKQLTGIYQGLFDELTASAGDLDKANKAIDRFTGKIDYLNKVVNNSKDAKGNRITNILDNLSIENIDKVLKGYDKVIAKEQELEKISKQEYRDDKRSATTVNSLKELEITYGNVGKAKDKYEEKVNSYLKSAGVETSAISKEIKEYSSLIALFEKINNTKIDKNILEKDPDAAIKKSQALLYVMQKITDLEKGTPLSNFRIGELDIKGIANSVTILEQQLEGSISSVIENMSKTLNKEIKDIYVNAAKEAEKWSQHQAIADAKTQEKLIEKNKKVSSGGNAKGGISGIGQAAQNAEEDVNNLGDVLNNLGGGKGGSGNELDLWAKSAENLSEEFANLNKYAKSVEDTFSRLNELWRSYDKGLSMTEDEVTEMWGLMKRFDELELNGLTGDLKLNEDQIDEFREWEDDKSYSKLFGRIEDMTQAQLAEIEKLKAAQKEVGSEETDSGKVNEGVQETNQEITELVQRVETLESSLSEMQGQLNSLNGEAFEKMQNDIAGIQQELSDTIEKLKELKSQISLESNLEKEGFTAETAQQMFDVLQVRANLIDTITEYHDKVKDTNAYLQKGNDLIEERAILLKNGKQVGEEYVMSDATGKVNIGNGIKEYKADSVLHTHAFSEEVNNLRFSDADIQELVDGTVKKALLLCGNEIATLDMTGVEPAKFESLKNDILGAYTSVFARFGAEVKDGKLIGIDSLPPEIQNQATDIVNNLIHNIMKNYGGDLYFDKIDNDKELVENDSVRLPQIDPSEMAIVQQYIEAVTSDKPIENVIALQKQFGVLKAELQEVEQQAKDTTTALSEGDQSSVLSGNQTEVLSPKKADDTWDLDMEELLDDELLLEEYIEELEQEAAATEKATQADKEHIEVKKELNKLLQGMGLPTEDEEIAKENSLLQEQNQEVVEIEQALNVLSERYIKLTNIVQSLSNGWGDVSDEVKNALQQLKLFDENGKFLGTLNEQGMVAQGAVMNGTHAIIARRDNTYDRNDPDYYNYGTDNYLDLLIKKEQEAYDEGVNLARILSVVEGYDGIYEIQEQAKGSQVHDIARYSTLESYIEKCGVITQATDEQLQKLLQDAIKLNNLGFNLDFGVGNILYDKDNGFTFIDLELRELDEKIPETQDLIRQLFKSLAGGELVEKYTNTGLSDFISEDSLKRLTAMVSVAQRLQSVFDVSSVPYLDAIVNAQKSVSEKVNQTPLSSPSMYEDSDGQLSFVEQTKKTVDLIEEESGQMSMFENVAEKATDSAIEGQMTLNDVLNKNIEGQMTLNDLVAKQDATAPVVEPIKDTFDEQHTSNIKEETDVIKENTDALKENADVQKTDDSDRKKKEVDKVAKAYEEATKTLKKFYDLKKKEYKEDGLGDADKTSLEKYKAELNDAITHINKYTVTTEEATKAQKKFDEVLDEYKNSFSGDIKNDLISKLNTANNKNNKTDSYYEEIKNIRDLIKTLNVPIDFTNQEEIDKLHETESTIRSMIKNLSGEQYNLISKDKITTSLNSAYKSLNRDTKAPEELRNRLRKVIAEFEKLRDSGKQVDAITFNNLQGELKEVQQEILRTGKTGASFGDKIKKKFGDVAAYFATYVSIQDAIQVVRQAYQYVADIDKQMIELEKVSDMSTSRLAESFEHATVAAKDLGSTVSDVISATADWSRLGYDADAAEQLAEVAILYKNVGDGIDISTANESLISTLQGFQLDASEAESVIDKFNEVANNYAIDSAGIGEALKRSAASFNVANTDLSESIALITATNTVIQDPTSVGTMWKTVSARIRGAKTELEDMGEDTDGMVESTSKLRDLIKGMTGFDIMEDENTFKSIYDIIVGIGKEWDNLNDIDHAGLLEALAGKRAGNALAAAIQNYELIEESYKTAEESAGSAQREQAKFEEGLEAKTNKLKASLEELSTQFLDSDFLGGLIDTGRGLIDILSEIIDKLGLLPTLIGSGGAIFGAIKAFQGNGRPKRRVSEMNMPLVA